MSWARSSTNPPALGTRLCVCSGTGGDRHTMSFRRDEMITAPQGWEKWEANGAEGWDEQGTGGLHPPALGGDMSREQFSPSPGRGPRLGAGGGTDTAPLWVITTPVGAPGVGGNLCGTHTVLPRGSGLVWVGRGALWWAVFQAPNQEDGDEAF